MESATIRCEGADIAYDVEGSGPLLLMVAGRGGTGGRYAAVSAKLKDAYRVVRYDRRCCGRSTGDQTRTMDLTQQARDALAVIEALGETKAYIFGNSAGASIALRLAEYYPEVPLGIIAHEPMIISILPDREHWIEFNRKADHLFRAEGVGPAMGLLGTAMVGLDAPSGGPPPGRPGEDMSFFLGNEVMSLTYYRPDLDRLRRDGTKLLASKGELSRDAYYARTADVLGAAVGRPARTMSGNHIAHVLDPTRFAAELRAILADLAGTAPHPTSPDEQPGASHVHR